MNDDIFVQNSRDRIIDFITKVSTDLLMILCYSKLRIENLKPDFTPQNSHTFYHHFEVKFEAYIIFGIC